jgi:hypothetical protein
MTSLRQRWAATCSVALLCAVAAGAGVAPSAASAETRGPNPIWGGYVVETFTVVTDAYWTVPDIDCSNNGVGQWTNATIWVGIGGFGTGTVAQVGIDARCDGGLKRWYAWWELESGGVGGVELPPQHYPVRPGDQMYAKVAANDPRTFALTLHNYGHGGYPAWRPQFEEVHAFPAGTDVSLDSGEAIVETPTELLTGNILPLTKFSDFQFRKFRVNNLSAESAVYRDDRFRLRLVAETADETLTLTRPDGNLHDDGTFRMTHVTRGPLRIPGPAMTSAARVAPVAPVR